MKKVFTWTVILLVLMSLLIQLFNESGSSSEDTTYSEQTCDEYFDEDTVQWIVTHHRSWEEYLENKYFCSNYAARWSWADSAWYRKDAIEVGEYEHDMDYWLQVYSELYKQNAEYLTDFSDSLRRLGQENGLDRAQFARMVVAMVQDVPYQYVVPEDCSGEEKSPCNPNIRFGIYAPSEFLYHLKGDCDTRTVFLYTIFKNLGYDPVIINSTEYLHSMLALDVPSSGEDFEYKGKRYAYWETTNTGWLAGMLPPDMNNEAYWDVALDYEFENNFTSHH